MVTYKTMLTDYEGMQTALDTHTEQGWKLFSVAADTWRKSPAVESGVNELSPFDELAAPGTGRQEYSAAYYLLIFQRDDNRHADEMAAAAEESLPLNPMHFFQG
jgi:hypothetical protein